jgi:hypothetical protein
MHKYKNFDRYPSTLLYIDNFRDIIECSRKETIKGNDRDYN